MPLLQSQCKGCPGVFTGSLCVKFLCQEAPGVTYFGSEMFVYEIAMLLLPVYIRR